MKKEEIKKQIETTNEYGQKQIILERKRIKIGEYEVEVRIIKTQIYRKKRWVIMPRAKFVKGKNPCIYCGK